MLYNICTWLFVYFYIQCMYVCIFYMLWDYNVYFYLCLFLSENFPLGKVSFEIPALYIIYFTLYDASRCNEICKGGTHKFNFFEQLLENADTIFSVVRKEISNRGLKSNWNLQSNFRSFLKPAVWFQVFCVYQEDTDTNILRKVGWNKFESKFRVGSMRHFLGRFSGIMWNFLL